MRSLLARLTLILAALPTSVLPASSQTVCGDRGRFIEQLGRRFGEEPAAIGMIDRGSVLELLTSERGSWTVLITRSDGTTCMLASGDNWTRIDQERGDPS